MLTFLFALSLSVCASRSSDRTSLRLYLVQLHIPHLSPFPPVPPLPSTCTLHLQAQLILEPLPSRLPDLRRPNTAATSRLSFPRWCWFRRSYRGHLGGLHSLLICRVVLNSHGANSKQRHEQRCETTLLLGHSSGGGRVR
jgi:hypothetical protein